MSEYRRILSLTHSLHVVVVVKGAGIHLGRKREETILGFLGKKWKNHVFNNPSFPQKAWDKMSTIKNSNSHLSVSGWGHELELRGIHEDRAVLSTIHVIEQGSGGAL